MESKIINNSGIFEITGSIVTDNATTIKNHFERLLDKSEELIMNLDRVNTIDATGVNVLSNLYKKAIQKNKALYIIGKENSNLKEAFSATKMDYILSRDFV
ncbi:STAS domain-containing protein [Flavobacteriaceae bacterium R38]|nr:STAS domain-containing protein [Flavobacteriaceae bacterium R38]